MNTLLALLLVFLTMTCAAQLTLNFPANAQTGVKFNGTEERLAIMTTNDFRRVDGKTYNHKQSALWKLYSATFQEFDGRDAIVNNVSAQGDSSTTPRTKRAVYLRHFIPDSKLSPGLPISFCAMNVGTTNIGGEVVEILDCGVFTTIAPVAVTNAPANKP